MATVSALRGGLATALDTIAGLRVVENFAGSVNPPVAVVGWPTGVEYDSTMARGADEWTFAVAVAVRTSSSRAAATNLDGYLAAEGAESVKAAIESDPTLGGVAQYAHVARLDGVTMEAADGGELLVASWTVEVLA